MVNEWKIQKELLKQPIPTHEQMTQTILNGASERGRLLACALYLSAGRISEVVSLKGNNIELTQHRYFHPVTYAMSLRDLLIFKNMQNKKHRRRHYKDIPVIVDKNKELVEYLINNIDTGNEYPIFPFTRRLAQMIIKKDFGFNPHYVRHVRLTNLVRTSRISAIELMKIAGWSSTSEADRYLELGYEDVVKKLIEV